jgi:hypothetical protein
MSGEARVWIYLVPVTFRLAGLSADDARESVISVLVDDGWAHDAVFTVGEVTEEEATG